MTSGRTRLPLAGALALALVLGACEHSTPFDSPDTAPTGPLTGGDPVRLTYGGTAGSPDWTPDGDAILFTMTDASRPDGDGCIGVMPRGGGSVSRLICHTGALTTDSLDWLASPALLAERLAYVRASRRLGAATDRERLLLVGPWEDPSASRRVQSIPFQFGTGQRIGISHVSWLDEDRLVFIARSEEIVTPCPNCDPILVEAGREIRVADIGGAEPVAVTVPITGNASSVAVAGTELFYTLAGDSRIYRGTVAGGATVVHDFGVGNVVRDVHVGGGTLAAIVGGAIIVDTVANGAVQRDGGGELWLMTLPGGTPEQYPATDLRFQSPAVSPDGEAVAVIARVLTAGVGGSITVGNPELWKVGE